MQIMENAIPLDAIDRRILRALQADGRISNLKLAEEVHLSPTAVLERVKRLTRDGFILGYEARLNPAKLGAGLLVFIEVLLDRTVHDVMDTFKAAVQVRPEIMECHLVAGGFDYLLKTRVADMAAYRAFGGDVYEARFDNAQHFDLEGLIGRVASSNNIQLVWHTAKVHAPSRMLHVTMIFNAGIGSSDAAALVYDMRPGDAVEEGQLLMNIG